jgi:hypothetical protein
MLFVSCFIIAIHHDLRRMTSHHYVGDPDSARSTDAIDGYWDDDIIRQIHEVLIEPRRLEQEKKVGKGVRQWLIFTGRQEGGQEGGQEGKQEGGQAGGRQTRQL